MTTEVSQTAAEFAVRELTPLCGGDNGTARKPVFAGVFEGPELSPLSGGDIRQIVRTLSAYKSGGDSGDSS